MSVASQGQTAAPVAGTGLTVSQWLACAVAGAGFMFDTYEIVIQSIVVRPALMDLTGLPPGSSAFNLWVGLILFLPFVAGGIAGLAGGYITDRFGRRRVLVWSIVLYGVATFGAANADSPGALLFWRCLTIVGVCTEWIAATAWITELFPDRRRRDAALGFTQAMSGVGIFLVAGVYYLSVTYGHLWPEIQGGHAGWRYALSFGALPLLPVLLARIGLPESPRWRELKAAGAIERPSFRELFAPEFVRVTIMTTVLVACIYGLAFGAMQHMPRIVPGLAEVRELTRLQQEQTISLVHFMQDLGGLIGRFALAFLVITALTRRRVLRSFQIPALFVFPVLFALAPSIGLPALACGALLAGIALNGQINFIGNYLPQVYPARLRGIGESFPISVGGRIIGTSTALITPWLATYAPGHGPAEKLAFAAAGVAAVMCVLGLIVSHFLIEPSQEKADSP